MYNGIGLQTARGSGTSGYVQANLSSVLLSKKRVEYNAEDDLRRMEAELNRKPNEGLLQHQRKRAVEIKCAEFETLMEEKGFDDEEIQKKVNDYRKLLLSQLESGELNLDDELDIKNSHARMQYAAKGRDRMRDALGLAKDFVPGSSMEGIKKASDIVDAALTPAPPLDEKTNMLATLKEMKKKEKEKKKAKKEEKKKRKRKESTSSSSSDSDSDSDSSSSDSSSSDSSEDEKRKSKKTKEKKIQEKEVKKEINGHDDRHAKTYRRDEKRNDDRRFRSPDNKKRREERQGIRRDDRRNERRNQSRSPQYRDRRDRRKSPPRRERRERSRSRSQKRRSSDSPDHSRRVKEEPLSENEQASPRRQTARDDRRSSDSYSSDEGHNKKMRSMVTKK